MNISIVLPCYNERENIAAAVRDVRAWMGGAGHEGEIIVVDDGSRDDSATILRALQQEIPNLKIVTHEKNQGYGLAVRSGLDAAAAEWIGFMDSDLQFEAKDFDLLLRHADSYSFLTGPRAHRPDTFVRNPLGKTPGAMNVIVFLLWVRDVNCGMKIFKREIWPAIRPTRGVEKLFNTEMFIRLKQNRIPWKTVNVPHYPRKAGSPTGGSVRVIIRMFQELMKIRFSR